MEADEKDIKKAVTFRLDSEPYQLLEVFCKKESAQKHQCLKSL